MSIRLMEKVNPVDMGDFLQVVASEFEAENPPKIQSKQESNLENITAVTKYYNREIKILEQDFRRFFCFSDSAMQQTYLLYRLYKSYLGRKL